MSESEKYEFFRKLDYIGFDPAFMIQEMFLGYKWRKSNGKLYGNDKRDIPTKLIKMYYELNPDEITFECLKKAFVGRYIRNESKLEDAHSKEEIDGLQAMYEYVHSDDINFMFNVYTLKDLNKKLFSLLPIQSVLVSLENFRFIFRGLVQN